MFHGSIVALVTPMQANGNIDYENLRRLLDWHMESGTDGVVILGTTGESPTVTLSEREKLIRAAVDHVGKDIPVIAGTGVNATAEAVHLTKQAMELGVEGCLVVTPYYNKPTQEGLFQHFKAVAESASIPQILYNVPSRTACDLLPETVNRLATIANIVAVKEASPQSVARVKMIDGRLSVLSGDDINSLAVMLAGGKGVISVVANVAPRQMKEMCQAALQGDQETATAINAQLMPLHQQLFVESNPIPVKWALEQMGRIAPGIRLPLTVLSESKRSVVSAALQQAKIV